MQSDTDLIRDIRDFIQDNPFITINDVIDEFTSKNKLTREKVLYILSEVLEE